MRVNKKISFAVAITAVAAASLTGCSSSDTGGEETSEGGTLTVWIDSNRADAMKPIAEQFEEEKGIKVDLVIRDFGKLRDDLTAQVPTGKGPDITIGSNDWIGALVNDGVIAPIELGDKLAEFEKVATDAITYDGKTYGVPYAIENIAILRNTALAPDPTPATYDEMIAAGKATGAEYPFLVGLDENNGDPYHLYALETSFGNEVFAQSSDGSYDSSKTTLGDAGGSEYATWLAEQGAAGILKPGLQPDLAKAAFNEGRAAYYLSGPWNVPDAQAAGIDVAVDPIPSAGGQPAKPFVSVQAFFISAKSENALAANEFLVNYIGTEEVQDALFEVGGRQPALTASAEKAASDPIIAGFAAAAENGVPNPSNPEMGVVWEDWGKTEVAILKGADPVSSWATMAETINGKIGG
ncbi:MAG: maltose ABC transporter substrate-binding protein [Microbacterium sp.]